MSRTIENVLNIKIGLEQRAIRIWPAVMLAHSRTDSVMGRISCLIDSIITINWERARGVERGTRCLRKLLVLKKIE